MKYGLYIAKSDWNQFGERRSVPTSESVVCLSYDGKSYTKMKSPLAKAPIKQHMCRTMRELTLYAS